MNKFEIICIWFISVQIKAGNNPMGFIEAFCTDGAREMTETISVFSSNAENSDMAYVLMPLPKSKMLNGMCLHF